MRYEWTQNSFPVDAQVAGEALAQVESANGGRLTPEAVVEAARPKESPLHKCFTWRDEKAAELWRQAEAAKLIRSVRVVQQESRPEAPARAVSITPMPPPAAAVYTPSKDERGEHFKRAPVTSRSEQLRLAINAALDNLTHAREKLSPYQEVGQWAAYVEACEVEVKAISVAAKKVCAQLEQIENGLVDELMPPKPQPIRDTRRLASV